MRLRTVRPERRRPGRWPDHRCLEHQAADLRTSLRAVWPIPISRASSRSRMTPALRGRRSRSFPLHSRTDAVSRALPAPWRGGTACVNGIARPSRNGRCQSKPAMGDEFAVLLGHCTGGHASGVASGSLRTWFATANATLRTTHAGRRSLLRTSAQPSPKRWLQSTGLASAPGTRRCTNDRVPPN